MSLTRLLPIMTLLILVLNTSAENEPITAVLSAESRFVGGPIVVRLTITNQGETPYHFDLGLNYKTRVAFRLTEPDDSQQVLRWHDPQSEGGIYEFGEHSLPPGETFEHRYILEEFGWDGNTSGIYHLTLVEPASVVTDPPALVVEVVKNHRALAEYCQCLMEEALRWNARDRLHASKALAHVEDPACLPMLLKALESEVVPGVVEALGNIGDREAILGLIAALERLDGHHDHHHLVRELRELMERVEDPELQVKIQQALDEAAARSERG